MVFYVSENTIVCGNTIFGDSLFFLRFGVVDEVDSFFTHFSFFYSVLMPMLLAVPATILSAASRLSVFKSAIFS